jgi:hypothetical protein
MIAVGYLDRLKCGLDVFGKVRVIHRKNAIIIDEYFLRDSALTITDHFQCNALNLYKTR